MHNYRVFHNDPTEDALLAAVLAAPDDLDVRLVYADYLDERGTTHTKCRACQGAGKYDDDRGGMMECRVCFGKKEHPTHDAERAELIRLQIEISKHPDGVNCGDFYCTSRDLCSSCSKFRAMCRRRDRLMCEIDRDWWTVIDNSSVTTYPITSGNSSAVRVVNGFTEEVLLSPYVWLRTHKAWTQYYPIRRVLFTVRPPIACTARDAHYNGEYTWLSSGLDSVRVDEITMTRLENNNRHTYDYPVEDPDSPTHMILKREWPRITFSDSL